MEGGQRFTPPPPNLTALSCPEVAPQPAGTDASGPAACSPAAPAPPPILPAPQRPPTRVREWEGAAWAAGATGVGAALSALPGSKRLGRVPLTFSEASPGPRTPRPARARKPPPGAGGRGGAEHPAARGSAQRPPLAPLLLASQVSPSLLRSVRSCVRLSVGPSLPRRRRRGRRRSSPGSAARPLPASPLRSRARGLAGSLARALPPPLPAPRGAEPGGPPAAWRGPSPEGGGDGGAARAGRREESGGGGEAAPLPPDRSPATERLQAGPESAEGKTRRTRRLAAGGCPGRGRSRGSDSPREEGSVRANGVDPSGSSCPRVQNSEISAWMPGIAWRSGGEAAPCLSRDRDVELERPQFSV
ncbi:hypothetical protein AB1E18_002308 [Capra hircus]